MAIGNGWVDPFYQYPAYNDFAYENNLVNLGMSYLLTGVYSLCEFSMLLEIPIVSAIFCELGQVPITGNPIEPLFNIYDIREECNTMLTCYPSNGLEIMMNNPQIR